MKSEPTPIVYGRPMIYISPIKYSAIPTSSPKVGEPISGLETFMSLYSQSE